VIPEFIVEPMDFVLIREWSIRYIEGGASAAECEGPVWIPSQSTAIGVTER
jgi:hypothetical protein